MSFLLELFPLVPLNIVEVGSGLLVVEPSLPDFLDLRFLDVRNHLYQVLVYQRAGSGLQQLVVFRLENSRSALNTLQVLLALFLFEDQGWHVRTLLLPFFLFNFFLALLFVEGVVHVVGLEALHG